MNKATFIKSNSAIYGLWIISFIVVLLLFIYFYIVFASFSGVTNSGKVTFSSGSLTQNLKPIDEKISTTLSYDKYKSLNDSINFIRLKKNGELNSGVYSPFGGATSLKFAMDKDIDHKSFSDQLSFKAPDSYFYVVKGWTIRTHNNSSFGDNAYYVKNAVPYLRKYVIKSTKGTHTNWEMKDDKLNYFCTHDDKTILIPISKNTYTFTQYTSALFMFVFVFFLLVTLLLAIKILYNISRGKVFIKENIAMFRQATFITMLIPLLFIFISLCQKLIFYNYFDDNVVLNIDFYKDQVKSLFVGIAVSILYSVFKRGFNIQQENDLLV
jgi:hypothetical protein